MKQQRTEELDLCRKYLELQPQKEKNRKKLVFRLKNRSSDQFQITADRKSTEVNKSSNRASKRLMNSDTKPNATTVQRLGFLWFFIRENFHI